MNEMQVDAEKLLAIWNPSGRLLAAEFNPERESFFPVCESRFKPGCRIGKGVKAPCKECAFKKYVPLNLSHIRDHVSGKRRMGIYPMLGSDRCNWIAADFDGHNETQDPRADVLKFCAAAWTYEVPVFVFSSNSGRGFHLYAFFQTNILAERARGIMFELVRRAGVSMKSGDGSFDSLFPKQDRLPEGSLGNLIALPFSGQAIRERGSTLLLDHENLEPYENNFQTFISALTPASDSDVVRIRADLGCVDGRQPPEPEVEVEDGPGINWDGRIESLPISNAVKEAIQYPPRPGKRSEPEFAALCACIKIGMSNSEIVRLWDQTPIGDRWRERSGGGITELCGFGSDDSWMLDQISRARKAVSSSAPRFDDLGPGEEEEATIAGGTNKLSQAAVAEKVIESFGRGNLIEAQSATWRYSGHGLWRRADPQEIKQVIHKYLPPEKLTNHLAGSILELARTKVYRARHEFDMDRTTINCRNGELHWNGDTWELRPHCREHYRTTQLPVVFNPEAKAPRFEKFLEEVFAGDPDATDKAKLILEVLGYSLLSTCDLEKFVILLGGGANGKSVLLAVLVGLVGMEHVASVQPSQFGNRFQLAHLQGKLINAITEVAEGSVLADAQLKALVSGEVCTAERKHRDPFDFKPFATCWFATNHMPSTRDFSDALFRRAIVIPFNRVFQESEQDKSLKDSLLEELPGILNLALWAVGDVLRRGTFTTAASVESARADWKHDADQVAQFIEDRCEIDAAATARSQTIYAAYKYWTDEAGIRNTLGRKAFAKRLVRFGVVLTRTREARVLSGIRLKNPLEGFDGDA